MKNVSVNSLRNPPEIDLQPAAENHIYSVKRRSVMPVSIRGTVFRVEITFKAQFHKLSSTSNFFNFTVLVG